MLFLERFLAHFSLLLLLLQYTFRVDDFTFGFEDLEPAQEWHGLLAQQLSELAATAGITPSKTRVKAPNKLARPSDDDFSSQVGSCVVKSHA